MGRKKKKSRKQNAEVKPKRRFFGKAVGLLVLAAAAYGFSFVPEWYENRKVESAFENRFKQYEKMMEGHEFMKTTFVVKRPKYTPEQKKVFVESVGALEKRVEENLDDFVEFLESHPRVLLKLTKSDAESIGRVYREDNFRIHVVGGPHLWLSDCLKEYIKGDFSNKKRIFEFSDYFPFPDQMRAMLRNYEAARGSMKSGKRNGILPYINPKSFKPELKDAEKMIEDIPKYEAHFQKMIEYFKGKSIQALDLDTISDPKLISRFHTHPKECEQYFPSTPDLADSLVHGPDILFARKDGVIYVHKINKGEYEQIYSVTVAEMITPP